LALLAADSNTQLQQSNVWGPLVAAGGGRGRGLALAFPLFSYSPFSMANGVLFHVTRVLGRQCHYLEALGAI
jgi:hypothetical protein